MAVFKRRTASKKKAKTAKPKLSTRDRKTLKSIKGMADNVVKVAQRSRAPHFDIPSRSLSNVKFNKTRKIIGVKISNNADEEGVLQLSRRRRSVSLKSPQFFHQYGLSVEESQRFEVTRDQADDMLFINVKDVKRRRGRRPKKA